jgi:hypothetical protein
LLTFHIFITCLKSLPVYVNTLDASFKATYYLGIKQVAKSNRRIDVSELAGVWISLSVALGLLLILVIAMLVSLEKRSTLERQRAELAEHNAHLRRVQDLQARDIAQLGSALRAEKAHVAQLLRKVELIQLMLDELHAHHSSSSVG